MRIAILLSLACLVGISVQAQEVDHLRFHPERGQCSFITPGGQNPVYRAISKGEGELAATVRLFCYDQPGVRCQVRYFDLPKVRTDRSIPEILGEFCLEKWANAVPLEKRRDGLEAQDEYEAMELRFSDVRVTRIRVYRNNSRIYVLSATSSNDSTAGAASAAEEFFKSFRIQKG